MTAELPIPLDWPWMALELSCDSCGAVVFSESVRPAILTDDAFPRLATYWRARMLDHVEKCPKRPGGAT